MTNLYDKWIKGKEEIIVSSCRNGATIPDLCRIIGCNKTTFHRIKNNEIKLLELLKSGKEEADLKVENALFKRACGFEYEEETNEVRLNPDGATGQVVFVKKVKKIIPPDTGAAMAWLKNRKPSEWNTPTKIDATNRVINLEGLTKDEEFLLEKLSDKYLNEAD